MTTRIAAVRWRRLRLLLCSLVPLLVLPGCFRLRIEVALRADGSGTQRVSWRIPAATVGRLERAAQAYQDASGTPFDLRRVMRRDLVAAELDAAGLDLTEHVASTPQGPAGAREATIAAGFGGLETLRKSPLLGSKVEWYVLPGRNPGNLRLVCYLLGSSAWREVPERLTQLRAAPEGIRQQFFAGQQLRLAGLDLQLDLELPSAVDYTSPNLETLEDGRTVRMTLRAADLRSAEDVVRALAPRFEVEFDGTGLRLPLDKQDPGLRDKRGSGLRERPDQRPVDSSWQRPADRRNESDSRAPGC